MKSLLVNLPQSALLTVYKSLIKPHLEYIDILYDKPDNKNFQNKIEKVQYKTCLGITMQYKNRQGKVYEKLGLHSLAERRWHIKLIFFSLIFSIATNTKSFIKSFFSYCINAWNNFKANIMNT